MSEPELLQLIEQAKRESWTELDLSGQYLTSLPAELGELHQLTALKLGLNEKTNQRNYLSMLPEWIAKLSNLKLLDVKAINLTVLPSWLSHLTNLQSLNISSNNLSTLPDWMARLTNLQSLNLSRNHFTELPTCIIQLTNLQSLDISYNKLTTISDSVAQIISLRSLNLNFNALTELSAKLAKLMELQSLCLDNTGIAEVPEWIGQLTNLRSLSISGNRLTFLPKGMVQLTHLQLLNISRNNLASLPNWVAALTNLQLLDLSYNNLIALPEELALLNKLYELNLNHNSITELPDWLADQRSLAQLKILRIGNNPLVSPSIEFLGDSTAPVNINSIRSYFRQLQEKNVVYFYEAKLLIIGEGGAGKTSLANKLLNPDCQLPSEEKSTKGIDILTWQFPLPATMADDDYQVNIWDFGGQAIYFATHQFFLTKRSVYLLVADTRRQHTDFFNWLRMQESFGGESAVLLIKNRNRQLGNSFTIENLAQLRERFPNLKEIIELDLTEVPTDAGWQDLLHHVKDYLLRLDHIGQPRPATWVAVRQAIDSDSRDVIRWDEFVTLCRAQGMKGEDDIRLLGEYLHNLGDILYFHEDPVLCDYVILKPTWGLDAVYKVLDNPEIETAMGKFTRSDLRSLWNDPIYNGYHLQLLRLMENFQLCYPLEGVKDTFIAPQLLTETVPGYTWDRQENLEVRYVYPIFMPRGILSRAIVKLHRRIESQSLVWRSGVILRDDYARAELLELRGDQMIRIRVSGRNKGDLLMEIVRALDELHLGFPKLRVERRIPCNCPACVGGREPHFFALEKLRERLANRKETIECQNPPYHEVPIRGMLDEMGPWATRGTGRGDTYNIYGDYVGKDKVGGDKVDVGNIRDSTGLAIGRKAAATVTRRDGGGA